jgi:hypothetical protein
MDYSQIFDISSDLESGKIVGKLDFGHSLKINHLNYPGKMAKVELKRSP